MGGANFWGGTKEDDVSLKACFKMFSKVHNDVQMYHDSMKGFWCPEKCFFVNYFGGFLQTFQAPSFDDKILEVVAVFGSVQMAMSRVIDIQHHRIAQVGLKKQEKGG